ncbi:gpi mannosyltransferase 2 [Phlyctema vagabunda]|uniref:GPI mannosyltransferase 2 n=1 Tax=Phlyctema vagabunda TaxID=108571 RepID=A0ABR4PKD0_9HELO
MGLPPHEDLEGLVAICIAHTSHLLSVLVLYKLTRTLFPAVSKQPLAFATSLLHVISPAGLFLSAPYAESSCALLSFLGSLLFTQSFLNQKQSPASRDLLIGAAGIVFAIATTFRSNALLNGLLFLEEAFRLLASLRHGIALGTIRRLILTGLGGSIIGIGFVVPQYIAYTDFCGQEDRILARPWCNKAIPSIYTFVQDHYWNVGFLRYWTVSNIPLFMLATPMLGILTKSGLLTLTGGLVEPADGSETRTATQKPGVDENEVPTNTLVRNMAVSQLILTALTLTSAHVQIITRISSAYPVWMWYIGRTALTSRVKTDYFIRFMVMYAVIQGVLFSSFLPPA